MEEEYIVECWYCLGEFDAIKAAWCAHPDPTKICPYCLNCSCNAPADYKKKFWDNAPPLLNIERVKLTSVKQRLGEILVADKKINSEQLLAALNKQEKTGEKIGEILIKMGLIKKEELSLYLLRQKDIPTIDILNKEVDIKLVQKFGIQTCLKYGIIPFLIEKINDDENRLHVAMANPYMPQLIKKLSKYMDAQIVYYQADKKDIEEKIKLILRVIKIKETKKIRKDDEIFNGFKELLNFAINKKASHLYLTKDFYKIRINMRINGTLFKVKSIDVKKIENYLEKLKITLGLEPNGNKFVRKTYELNKTKYNLIIKNEGLAGKESLEVDIINLNNFGQDLSEIGLSMYETEDINAALSNKLGVITVSAPIFNETSSLMYSLINKIKGDKKILSIEKEILMKVSGIKQIYYDKDKKDTIFESIYKLEPEIIFIHDLKNPEIMKEIFNLSKNYLFIIEIYAKSSARTIIQLKNYFKINDIDLSKNLKLIINKRLIRILCEKCKSKVNPTIDFIDKLNLSEEDSLMFEFYKERGCQFCNFTGFSDRIPLFEVLKITDELKQLIKEGGDENIIQKIAIENGMITLSNNAMSLLSNGLTSANELRKQGLI